MAETANPEHELTSLLVRTMVLLCFRNSVIEDIHAGLVPVTRTGDYSDVTVIGADGRRIPWPEVSHIDQNAMCDLMRQVVDRLYTFGVRAEAYGLPRKDRAMGARGEPVGRAEARSVLPALPDRKPDAAMTETITDGPGPHHAFAPHPDPVVGLRHRHDGPQPGKRGGVLGSAQRDARRRQGCLVGPCEPCLRGS